MHTDLSKITVARRCAAATVVTTLLGLPLAGAAGAQDDPPPTFTEKVEVTEVLLDVVVTDRAGNLVAGLGPNDFVIEENGREIALTGADFYTTRYGAESPRESTDLSSQEALEAIPASRYIVFFFHDARTMANRLNRLIRQQMIAGRDCAQWIEQEMQPSDWVAVTGFGMRLKVFQDFTQDREALLAAMAAAAKGVNPDRDQWTRDPPSPTAPSLLRHLPSGKDLSRQTRQIYAGMRLLAEATGHIVGRKTMLYFGIGFGELDSFDGNAIADRRYYPELEQALNDNNIAVYPIDLTIQGTRHAQSSFLNSFANDTGGVYYRNFASFLGPLTAISNANVGYYLLSYRSEHPRGERGYQRVKVRMLAPELVVQAQRGYRYGSHRP